VYEDKCETKYEQACHTEYDNKEGFTTKLCGKATL
jgi:hypothetical protein